MQLCPSGLEISGLEIFMQQGPRLSVSHAARASRLSVFPGGISGLEISGLEIFTEAWQ